MRLLHVTRSSVYIPQHRFLGSTKDIRGRSEYFASRNISFDEISFDAPNNLLDKRLLTHLRKTDLSSLDAVFFEYPIYARSISYLHNNFPQIKRIIRSANAELYHRLHYALASLYISRSIIKAFIYLVSSFKHFAKDYLCGRRATWICSIARWEAEHYWGRFTEPARVKNLPFFLPAEYEKDMPLQQPKKHQCTCLMSTTKGTLPFLLDGLTNFSNCIEKLGDSMPEWQFYVTGESPQGRTKLPGRLNPTGFLQNPYDILASSLAVAVLSDYGFGFKTKILEAILCNAYVLVTKKLFGRLPVEVQPFCIVVDPLSSTSFRQALLQCLEPFPTNQVNALLRQQAFSALDQILFH
jgi:hypothetical protein